MMRLMGFITVLLLAVSLPVAAQNEQDKTYGTQTATESPAPVTDVQLANEPADKTWSTSTLSSEQQQSMRNSFQQRFPGIKVESIRISPMPGLFEVQVGLDILYTDANVDYVIQGSIIDARKRLDLTAERIEDLQRVAFNSLPLERAIRQVKGTGEHVFAVFEDPNCGYCKQLHKTLESIDDTTVYTFLYPILTPDSSVKSRNIWCSGDPAKAWKDWMISGVVPTEAECEAPLQSNLELGRKLNIQGTPALFFPDGSRVNGALPLESLQQKLAAK